MTTSKKYFGYDETGNVIITSVHDNYDDAYDEMLAKLKLTESEYISRCVEEFVYVKEVQKGEVI